MVQRYGGKPLSIVWTGWTSEICIFLRINQFFIMIRTIINRPQGLSRNVVCPASLMVSLNVLIPFAERQYLYIC